VVNATGVCVPKAIDLFREGRDEELWQMCCGYLRLNIDEFMDVQKRLLLEQLELLNSSKLGDKIMRGARPRTVEEFRRFVPLTTYKDYCPELLQKQEDTLPSKPSLWVHSSGWSGEFPYKWVPMSTDYALELSKLLYGIGMISCAKDWGDTSRIPDKINLLYAVAARPYISGTFADVLTMQTPLNYLPSLDEAEHLNFEDRIKLGLQHAMSQGLDYFFGLSLVLVAVGEKFRQSTNKVDLRPFIAHPRALWRLGKGLVKSRLAKRQLLPKDLWSLKGIIGSGVDSLVYKDKIKELWGKNPLDLYSCTEGGIIATQTWDYEGMSFIPNLNFFEFIPEDEQLKWQMDHSYRPKTLLLDEVKAGENYEIVITNLYGGALARYRIGDMVRIQSLRNDKLGIDIPQMTFERRVDDYIDFYAVRLTEKSIWQAIESTGVVYQDWIAYKNAGSQIVNIGLELKEPYAGSAETLAAAIFEKLAGSNNGRSDEATRQDDLADMADFGIKVDILPKGTFADYINMKQAEGADLAHLKAPHVNPSPKIISILTHETEETITVTKSRTRMKEGSPSEELSITP